MNNPAEIKDECFLLLIKQITDNPYLKSNYNEWKLMAIIATFISPSETFIYFFINKMEEIFETSTDDEIK